jgi:hypothetical protein
MATRLPDDEPPAVIQQLDQLRKELTTLRERIDTAQEEDRRRAQMPYAGPDRRRAASTVPAPKPEPPR